MENITLSEMIPTEILQTVQDAFSEYSGLAAVIADANGVPVTERSNFTDFCKMTRASECGSANCQRCGREAAMRTLKTGKSSVYQCHTGMVDFSAPILLEGKYMGHFAGGQTRVADLDEEFIRKKAREYDIDEEEYLAAAKRNNVTDWEWVEKSADFLSSLATALSSIAYERMQILEEKKIIEASANNQLDFMRDFADGANTSMQVLSDYVAKLASGEKDTLDSGDREYLADANSILQSRITRINESLVRTEITRGDVTLNEGAYDIRLMFERKVSQLENIEKRLDCKVECYIDEDMPRLLVGDSAKMGEAIDKYITVAYKISKPDLIRVELLQEHSGYGINLVIKVYFCGVDWSEEELSKFASWVSSVDMESIRDRQINVDEVTELRSLLSLMTGSFHISRQDDDVIEAAIVIPQYVA